MINVLRCLLAAPLFFLATVCFGLGDLLGNIGIIMQRASKRFK